MSEHANDPSRRANDAGNNTELFNALKILEAEVFKTGAARYITGLDPNVPLPSIFGNDIKKAAPGDSIAITTGIDTPVVGGFVATAGMKDIDITSDNHKSFTQYHAGNQHYQADSGHGIG
ncbi:hypothetical protein CAXC1_310021 [Candidatus Xenohaliotis californiensis]|uniref:Uncharacterized protein n=1 Tax=Candidatus Xenohaliotis californiensis TaxID=84677 RepID=A0ABP0EUA5_9RICK|nr:hypothetical protein CAXC1_310021 [Candidatus Xenohaliotis californiensis]